MQKRQSLLIRLVQRIQIQYLAAIEERDLLRIMDQRDHHRHNPSTVLIQPFNDARCDLRPLLNVLISKQRTAQIAEVLIIIKSIVL